MPKPEGFDFRGVYCYRSKDDPATFFYLVGDPTPEKDALGRPTLTLWVSDQGAILQFGSWLQPGTDLLAGLKNYIVDQFKLDPIAIRLSPAPVAVKGVTVAVGDGTGKFQDLHTAISSGYPPFAAIFNLQLTPEHKAAAMAALNGRMGFLTVTYQGILSMPVSIETSIEGDVKAEVVALGETATLADCLARIETALLEGRLTLKRTETAEATDELRQKAYRLAKQKAAILLQQMVRNASKTLEVSTLKATAALTEAVPVPITRVADLNAWFPNGKGMEHIRVLPTTVETPPGPARPPIVESIKLGFDASEAPIAFVQITRAGTNIVIREPNFEPVQLAVEVAGKPIMVKTTYTDGGPPYEVTLSAPSPEGWILAPTDLGLVKVVVDGYAPQTAGSTQARVQVHYEPSGQGTKDDRMVTFRGKQWTSSWYLVTRSPELAGYIEFAWTETTIQGDIVKHSFAKTAETEIRL